MSYAEKFLKAHGQDTVIQRAVPVSTKVSIKRSTKSSRDLGSREAYWEGLVLASAALQSGEVLTIGADNYLVQSVNLDPASGEYAFFAAKANSALIHKRLTETADANNNFIRTWQTLNANVKAYGEIVTYQLRQFDPGLLPQTRYIFQVPKSIGIIELDRMVYNGDNYQVDSIDDVALKGIVRIQLSVDVRPD